MPTSLFSREGELIATLEQCRRALLQAEATLAAVLETKPRLRSDLQCKAERGLDIANQHYQIARRALIDFLNATQSSDGLSDLHSPRVLTRFASGQ